MFGAPGFNMPPFAALADALRDSSLILSCMFGKENPLIPNMKMLTGVSEYTANKEKLTLILNSVL